MSGRCAAMSPGQSWCFNSNSRAANGTGEKQAKALRNRGAEQLLNSLLHRQLSQYQRF